MLNKKKCIKGIIFFVFFSLVLVFQFFKFLTSRFRICLRNVTASDECIENACSLLEKNGFINYYGLQRFGTRIEVPTYEIGKKMLQGKLREVFMLVFIQNK